MERLEHQGRRGLFHFATGAAIEHIQLNRSDPWTEVEGERSSVQVPHPLFTDLRVRQAFALAVDRRTIAEQLYGATGQVTSNVLNAPKPFQSSHTRWEFDLEKAAQLLEQDGWKRGSDGVRRKDDRRMRVLFQTNTNLRQKAQAIVKKALERLGIDPQGLMFRFVSWEIAHKANNWAGRNHLRWANAEYDRLWREAGTELDPVKRAALFIRMNDLLVEDVAVIPVVWRNNVSAVSHMLWGMALSPWDWNLSDWHIGTGRPEDARCDPAGALLGHCSYAPLLPLLCPCAAWGRRHDHLCHFFLDPKLVSGYLEAVRIIAKKTLREFWERPPYRDAEQPLKAWFKVASAANWASPAAVKADYGNASILEHNRVCFNIGGNKYRLVVQINYPYRVVYIRFIGTHTEYDKIDVATV
jgi:mRNA-degrading endonuclease HigB of HigAB toxin-antitoxin module